MTRIVVLSVVLASSVQAQTHGCPGRLLWAHDATGGDPFSLGEALRWALGATSPTVDGMDAVPVARPVGAEPVRWVVDGLPIAMLPGDGPEALPVARAEVARVTYCAGPGLAGGVWGGPWVEVETRADTRLAAASLAYGNETGDPGPERYLDPDLPNVERWGPVYDAAARVAGVGVAFRERSHFPTDALMLERVREALVPERFPKRRLGVAALSVSRPGRLLVQASTAWADDLPHVEALGREVPERRRDVQAAARAVLARRADDSGVLYADAHAARLARTRPAWSALDVDPAWTEWRAHAGVRGYDDRLPHQLRAGAGLVAEWTRVEAPGLDATDGAARLWGEVVQSSATHRWSRRVEASVVAGSRGVRPGASVEQTWSTPQAGTVSVLAAVVPRTTPTRADWQARGYTALGPPRTPDAPAVAGEALVRVTAEQWLGASAWRLVGAAEVSYGADRALPAGVATGRAVGTAATAYARVTRRVGGRAQVSVFGAAQGALGGTGAFGEAWRRMPPWRAGVEARAGSATLDLWARAEGVAPTRWAGVGDERTPAMGLVDLGLGRSFVGGRLRGSLGGRNVLGGWLGLEERWHPLGADLAPRLFVRLEGRL